MKKRILVLLSVAALMAAMMVASAMPAFAQARGGGGCSPDALFGCGGGGFTTVDVPAGPHQGTHTVLGFGGNGGFFPAGGGGQGVGGGSF